MYQDQIYSQVKWTSQGQLSELQPRKGNQPMITNATKQ